MRILKILLSILLILVGIFIAGGFLIPSKWEVSRTTIIHATPEQIYPLINNFKEWEQWSPWSSKSDSSLKYTYEGPETGAGSKQSWTSEKMDKGWMQFTSASPKSGITYDLYIDMGQMQSTLHGAINFEPVNDETKVIWTDKGKSGKSFVKRWMSVMFKPMLGKDLDTGLVRLKAYVEKSKK
jgi:hypothetical protein